jgi:hypothetical protein
MTFFGVVGVRVRRERSREGLLLLWWAVVGVCLLWATTTSSWEDGKTSTRVVENRDCVCSSIDCIHMYVSVCREDKAYLYIIYMNETEDDRHLDGISLSTPIAPSNTIPMRNGGILALAIPAGSVEREARAW